MMRDSCENPFHVSVSRTEPISWVPLWCNPLELNIPKIFYTAVLCGIFLEYWVHDKDPIIRPLCYKWHPISIPDMWFMGCLLSVFLTFDHVNTDLNCIIWHCYWMKSGAQLIARQLMYWQCKLGKLPYQRCHPSDWGNYLVEKQMV